MMQGYSADEQRVIKAIAKHIRRDDYRRVDEEYMFDMKWSEIHVDRIDLYDRLLQALEDLRKRNFDSYSAEETTLNGYIMKAKVDKSSETVKLLISPDLVLQLLADYKDEATPATAGSGASIEELKAMVGVG